MSTYSNKQTYLSIDYLVERGVYAILWKERVLREILSRDDAFKIYNQLLLEEWEEWEQC